MKLEQLVERLNYHRDMYYKGFADNAPAWLIGEDPISDDEFDDLVEDIKKLDPSNSAIASVGSASSCKFKHENRMGSLAKVKTFDAVKEWLIKYCKKSTNVWILPKYDGLSLTTIYKNGKLKTAATRGDGISGEAVTENAKFVRGIPRCFSNPSSVTGTMEVRGECVMLRSVFDQLNQTEIRNGNSPFKNPRNAASGSLKHSDPKVCEKRKLDFFAYDVVTEEKFDTYEQILQKLQSLGFNTGHAKAFSPYDYEGIQKYLGEFSDQRKNLDFMTDGAVLILDSTEDQENAGWSSDMHHPNGKIAFKFPSASKQTVIRSYRLQVGKTGKITPVADIDPVEIEGSVLQGPTLHNFGNMIDNGLFPGAVVTVKKANDVIPYINKEVIKPVFQKFDKYPVCPCCGTETRFDGVNLWCENPDCVARLESKMIHFVNVVNCLDVGEQTIHAMIESGYLKDLTDFVKDTSVAEIAKAIGSSSLDSREAEIAYNALKGIKNLELHTFIEALCISNCAKGTSKRLEDHFKTLDAFLNTDMQTLLSIADIGPVTAESIMKNISTRKEEIVFVASKIGIKEKVLASNALEGKSFLFTGTLSKPRKVFENIVESNGGKVAGSVSKTLNFLIVGEEAGSKLAKAQKLGVKTLTEAEFMEMI